MMNQEQLQVMTDIAKDKRKQINPMVWMGCTSTKHHCTTIPYQSIEKFMTLEI